MALIFIPKVLAHLLTPILPYNIWHMSDGIGIKYGIFDINDAFGTRHFQCLDMATWVSKDALRLQECRPMPLHNFWISLTGQNFKILTFKIFLCIFWNFLCIMYEAWGGTSHWSSELIFMFLESVEEGEWENTQS